jgi:hypothetical protein
VLRNLNVPRGKENPPVFQVRKHTARCNDLRLTGIPTDTEDGT